MHGRIRLMTALVLANAHACQMLVQEKTLARVDVSAPGPEEKVVRSCP